MTADLHHSLVESLTGRSILVIGDVMLDEYVWGQARRISAEAPVPVVEVQSRTYHPGGAANVAANIAALGGCPLLVGAIGDDASARHLLAALRDRGIAVDGLLTDPGRPTTTKTRLVAQNQQVVRMDSETCTHLPPHLEDWLLGCVERQLADADACLIADYAKGVASAPMCQRIIRLARAAGKKVIIDPKGADYRKYRGATILKPNVLEVCHVLKQELDGDAALHDAGRQLVELLEGAAVLVTRGHQGMLLFQPGQAPWEVRSVARKVFDVTGAGDTVVSLLALVLAGDGALEHAVHLANIAAGIVVGKFGTATATPAELLQELRTLTGDLPPTRQ
jgi:rfaE bifunctional protein kinase chain/domain